MRASPGYADLLVVGVPGPRLERTTEAFLKRLQPGGVILFPRNIEGVAQLHELVRVLRRVLPEALLYLDAEGGRVDRLRRVVAPAPAAAELGRQPPRRARQSGLWVGHSLRLFGFDVDLAPVTDLDHGERDNALAERCFGSDPSRVIARARAFLEGLHRAGVGGCLKHFPGLGGALRDTHLVPSEVRLSAGELEGDLEPFRALAERAGAVMLSHATYPGLGEPGLPASLSPSVATGLLRDRLGFQGVAFSDDLEMKALGEWGDLAERGACALTAGCDGLLVCHTLGAATDVVEGLRRAVPRRRVAEARARLWAYRESLFGLRHQRRRYRLATIRGMLGKLAGRHRSS